MKRSKKELTGMIMIAIALIIAGVSYLMLPDVMIVQIGLDGKGSNTLPKLPGLLIPLAISTVSSIQYMKSKTSEGVKNLMFAVLGLGIGVFAFVINFGR
ncbi:MAG: hypothetical protein QMB61_04770 [Clostridiaceae bacterium]